MWLYLFAMFFVIATLIGFVVFAYVVTDKGSGRAVQNRVYLDYYLEDYSGWLEERVKSDSYWGKISSCIRDSKSGCCKPPSECGFVYVNETTWNPGGGLMGNLMDCTRWSNDQEQLCYSCDSCKAGVVASLKKSWRKVSIINIVVLIILVIVYVIGLAAFRNNKRMDNDEPFGMGRMTKAQPSVIQF
ncbi:hypothetical protein Scep_015676 [Stephania cephalantha]|uniref:Tetraspanin-3 n=1 Tax=Stephania cephalantha TaxID=152367 RepID=A0AAP0J4E5_9MAGN